MCLRQKKNHVLDANLQWKWIVFRIARACIRSGFDKQNFSDNTHGKHFPRSLFPRCNLKGRAIIECLTNWVSSSLNYTRDIIQESFLLVFCNHWVFTSDCEVCMRKLHSALCLWRWGTWFIKSTPCNSHSLRCKCVQVNGPPFFLWVIIGFDKCLHPKSFKGTTSLQLDLGVSDFRVAFC